MIVTFCGHQTVMDKARIVDWINLVTENLILKGQKVFYLGGYGEFDMIVKLALNKQKLKYPHIEIVLILAYHNSNIDKKDYCYTLYPPIETVPKRFAILKRNEWMVAQSDILVAYVTHGWGGAAKTLEFAKRKNKRIILYQEYIQENNLIEKG